MSPRARRRSCARSSVPIARVLVDTGAFVALFDRRDRHHARVAAAWRSLRSPVETIWPVLTEAFHLLDFSSDAVEAMFDLVETGAMRLLPLSAEDVPRIRQLMARYSSVPMDLTDACLVRIAERERIKTVFTVDRRGF